MWTLWKGFGDLQTTFWELREYFTNECISLQSSEVDTQSLPRALAPAAFPNFFDFRRWHSVCSVYDLAQWLPIAPCNQTRYYFGSESVGRGTAAARSLTSILITFCHQMSFRSDFQCESIRVLEWISVWKHSGFGVNFSVKAFGFWSWRPFIVISTRGGAAEDRRLAADPARGPLGMEEWDSDIGSGGPRPAVPLPCDPSSTLHGAAPHAGLRSRTSRSEGHSRPLLPGPGSPSHPLWPCVSCTCRTAAAQGYRFLNSPGAFQLPDFSSFSLTCENPSSTRTSTAWKL